MPSGPSSDLHGLSYPLSTFIYPLLPALSDIIYCPSTASTDPWLPFLPLLWLYLPTIRPNPFSPMRKPSPNAQSLPFGPTYPTNTLLPVLPHYYSTTSTHHCLYYSMSASTTPLQLRSLDTPSIVQLYLCHAIAASTALSSLLLPLLPPCFLYRAHTAVTTPLPPPVLQLLSQLPSLHPCCLFYTHTHTASWLLLSLRYHPYYNSTRLLSSTRNPRTTSWRTRHGSWLNHVSEQTHIHTQVFYWLNTRD